jgi:hypothetical protein
MVSYLIRFAKYLIYYTIFITAVLALVFYTSNHGDLQHFWEMIPPSNYWQVALFVVAFAAIYPFIGFVERKVYLNRSFEEDRDTLIEPVLHANYQIIEEHDQKIVFCHKGNFTRLMRLYEDAITIDFSNNPIVIKGMRRDVYRFARSMEYLVRQL